MHKVKTKNETAVLMKAKVALLLHYQRTLAFAQIIMEVPTHSATMISNQTSQTWKLRLLRNHTKSRRDIDHLNMPTKEDADTTNHFLTIQNQVLNRNARSAINVTVANLLHDIDVQRTRGTHHNTVTTVETSALSSKGSQEVQTSRKASALVPAFLATWSTR